MKPNELYDEFDVKNWVRIALPEGLHALVSHVAVTLDISKTEAIRQMLVKYGDEFGWPPTTNISHRGIK